MAGELTSVLVRMGDRLSRDLVVETLRAHGFTPILPAEAQPLIVSVQEFGPDVVILDLALDESFARLERTLVDVLANGARALLVADGAPPQKVLAGLLAGASGQVLLETTSPQRFLRAVRQVAEGSAALHPDIASMVLEQWRQARSPTGLPRREVELSSRELQILARAAEGLTNQAIGRQLEVSPKTVENHKGRIFAKLGARNQAEALSMAIRRGLLGERP